jgi:hypothetical protein
MGHFDGPVTCLRKFTCLQGSPDAKPSMETPSALRRKRERRPLPTTRRPRDGRLLEGPTALLIGIDCPFGSEPPGHYRRGDRIPGLLDETILADHSRDLRVRVIETIEAGGRNATTRHIPPEHSLAVGMPSTSAPDGWRWSLLADIVRLESGHTPSRGPSIGAVQFPGFASQMPGLTMEDAHALFESHLRTDSRSTAA